LESEYKAIKVEFHMSDGTIKTFDINEHPYLLLYESDETIECVADLSPEFVQELLIINPALRFSEQYEKGEIG